MTLPETISADYTLRPSELAEVLALLVEARQPTMVWGPPGAAKSMIARQVAAAANRNYVDVRALLLDPVDLRGIPWRDSADRTRWAPPVFLPPSDDPGLWLINLEELPSAVPMVQAALYQLFLERKCGEYALPEGASLIACGNRDADRAVVHRMPTPLSNRLVHLEIRVDAKDWCAWGASNGIAPEVLFFIELEPELLHQFQPQSKEHAFPSPRSWEFASNIVKHRNGLDAEVERALFRGTVGEAAAVQFTAFLKVWRELPHPRAVINDPENADVPENASTLMALCGYRNDTGGMWRPRRGSHASQTGKLTSAAIDARDYQRARKDRKTMAHLPQGTLVAIAGGKDIANPAAVIERLDKAREKYADMVLVHGGGPGVEKIAASWAERNGVHQIVCKPDWDRHGRAAPFRRNDELLNLLPKGVIAFPGSGITENLVDKARQLGIPVQRIAA